MARYKRMKGFNVLHPMGWDSFGLPAEQFAIKQGVHPAARTGECIANFKRQLKMLGFSYDWRREIATSNEDYYRWTQWIFLKIWGSWYDHESDQARPIEELPVPAEVSAAGDAAVRAYQDEHRLAYLEDAPVNWCPVEKVVLANEEVAEHVEKGHAVSRKPMTQWMLRITKYAQRLLDDLRDLDWSPHVLKMQHDWIGRSEGAEVDFQVDGVPGDEGKLSVFTTRPDTLFGATYMVLAPEHPLVSEIATEEQRGDIEAYVQRTALRSERDRQIDAARAEKTGVFTGGHAINPVNGERIPIWIGDYVLMGYGTGAIMAVPGHDERDHAFAKTMGLEIREVVAGGEAPIEDTAFPGEGRAVNSGLLDGLETPAAKAKIIEWLEAEGKGTGRVTYKLRDWLFSRQRYWGEPFPLLHDTSTGAVHGVATSDLPVSLPEMDDFTPSETGDPLLAKAGSWVEEVEGHRRETNTMPQWAGSCWYYLRFADPGNGELPWSDEAERYWLPVDLYVGGAEHAVLHLLYARFWHKVLFDLGYVSTKEPFKKLVNQGMVLGATYVPKDRRKDDEGKVVSYLPGEVRETEEGSGEWVHVETAEPLDVQWDKMSKSRGNVVNPDHVIREFGADTMRLYEMFMGPLEASAPWQPKGVVGCFKFLRRAHALFFIHHDDESQAATAREFPPGEGSERQRKLLHRTISEVSERIERMGFNTAISSLMVFVRDITKDGEPLHRDAGARFAQMLSPFAPHLAEELWQRALGCEASLTHAPWPTADASLLVEDTWTLVLMNGKKKRGELQVSLDPDDEEAIKKLALESEAIVRALDGREPKRVIYVKKKLVNIVG
jgi:leucyl-tRNA synthetase